MLALRLPDPIQPTIEATHAVVRTTGEPSSMSTIEYTSTMFVPSTTSARTLEMACSRGGEANRPSRRVEAAK